MCLILLSNRENPRYPLVLAANRDEFYERPTAPLARWQHAPDILAGRDVRRGGTWLGSTENGRWAAVTNYREPGAHRSGAPSRGLLVSEFLTGGESAAAYLRSLITRAEEYNGFNLLLGDETGVYYYSNRTSNSAAGACLDPLPPGLYGVSNHLLDSPWPKVQKGKRALADLLARENPLRSESVLDLLLDRGRPADGELPDTGIGLELERLLGPVFISSPTYGTRSSSMIRMDSQGQVTFVERTFEPGNDPPVCAETNRWTFTVAAAGDR